MDITDRSDRIDLHISAKGDYYWDISINGTDVKKIEEINNQMKERFKNEDNEIDTPDI